MGVVDIAKEILERAQKFLDVVEEKAKQLDALVQTHKGLVEKSKTKVSELATREKAIKASEHKIKSTEELEKLHKAHEEKFFAIKKERKELDVKLKAFSDAQERFAKEKAAAGVVEKPEKAEAPAEPAPEKEKKPKKKAKGKK